MKLKQQLMSPRFFILNIFIITAIFIQSCNSSKTEESSPFLEHSKFLKLNKKMEKMNYSIVLFQSWSQGNYVKTKGHIQFDVDRITVKFNEMLNNQFDLINPAIINGDTNIIHWEFIPNDINFTKDSFKIYLNTKLSDKNVRVVTFDQYGLLEISDDYNLVLDKQSNRVIGEFVTIKPQDGETTYVIHTEGIVPQILNTRSEYTHKRIL